MKRFICVKEGYHKLSIYDSHNTLLADFKTDADGNINLYDKKNEKVQYRITPLINAGSALPISYSLYQDDTFVGETTPSPTNNQHIFIIGVSKYGNNLQIDFRNKTDFTVYRDSTIVAHFGMTDDCTGYFLDISKGERRNFSFVIVALYVFWAEDVEVAAAVDAVGGGGGGKGGVSNAANAAVKKAKSTVPRVNNSKNEEKLKDVKLQLPKKTSKTPREHSDSEPEEEAQQSDGDENDPQDANGEKPQQLSRQKRRSSSKVSRNVVSARTSIPLKSPRVNNSNLTGSMTSRKTESSNSVINALLQRKKAEEGLNTDRKD